MNIGRTGSPALGIVIAIGAISLVVGLGLDGFVGGMLQGAGLALVLLGVYGLGLHHRSDRSAARGEEPQTWLPSRDGER